MNRSYSEEELIAAMQAGGKELNEVLHFLYTNKDYKQSLFSWVQSHKGSLEDAEDVFQDGIRYLVLNVRAGRFEQRTTIKNYLKSICRNLWFTKFAKNQKIEKNKQEFSIQTIEEETPEHHLILQENTQKIADVLSLLGEKCQQVLGYWSLSYSMKEIAKLTGYKSEEVVRKKKHLCLKKLVLLVHNDEDLMRELGGF